jgi:DNA-binding NtrC family response regulator
MQENAMAEKILIVDDELDMLELLKRIIEDKTEYQVVTTPDPLDVPRILEENSFDLVITDLRMPGQSGMELLETIRQKDDQIPFYHSDRLRNHRIRRRGHAERGFQLYYQAL